MFGRNGLLIIYDFLESQETITFQLSLIGSFWDEAS